MDILAYSNRLRLDPLLFSSRFPTFFVVWTFLGPGSGRTLSEWESFNTIRYYLFVIFSDIEGQGDGAGEGVDDDSIEGTPFLYPRK